MKLLGFPNVIARPYCTASTSGAALLVPAGFEASFLKSEEPSDLARLATCDPMHTQWVFDFNGIPSDIEGLALINWNGSPTSYYRFSGGPGAGAVNQPTAQAPNAMPTFTNVTGGVTNVDEAIYSPDALFVGPTTLSSPWDCSFSWGPLAHTPVQGTAMAQFVLRMQLFGNGAGLTAPLSYPKLEIWLQESGSLVAKLNSRAVTETGGQVFIFPFNPALLTDPTGANLEMFLACSSGLSASGNTYAKLESVALYYEWSIGVDTLWLPAPFATFGEDADGPQPTKSVHHFTTPGTGWENLLSLNVRILDDGCVNDPHSLIGTGTGVPVGLIPRRPDGFVQAGAFCAGGVIAPDLGIRNGEGPAVKVITEGVPGLTVGGQTFGADQFRRRSCDMVDFYATRDEAMEILDRVTWRKGQSGAFYVALEPEVAGQYQMFTSFWATAKDHSPPRKHGRYKATGDMGFTMGLSFEEKL